MDTTNIQASISSARKQGTKLWKKRVKRFMNNRLAMFGLIIVAIYLFLMIFAPIIC